MKNADQPAYPLAYESRYGDSDQFVSQAQEFGLTKREYFAAKAMSALIASGCAMTVKEAADRNLPSTAFLALDLADDLLRSLDFSPFEDFGVSLRPGA